MRKIPGLNSIPTLFLALGLCAILLVPIVPIAPWLQTFIHPWRPELAASLFSLILIVCGWRNEDFRSYLAGIGKTEIFAIMLPCLAFTAWSFISALYAGWWRSSLHHSLVWAIYFIIFIFAGYFFSRSADLSPLFVVLTAATLMIGLPAVIEYFFAVNPGEATTIGIRYAKYAELFNTVLPFIAAYSLGLKGKTFWLGAATVLLIWLFDIASLSRTAIGLAIVGFVALAAIVFILRRYHPYRKRAAVLAGLVIIAPVVLHLPSYFGAESVVLVDRFQNPGATESTNVRPFFSRIALQMLKEHPLTGVGADNFGQEFHRYRAIYATDHNDDPNLAIAEGEVAERAHNEYTQIAAELGVPGVLLFGWFLLGIAWIFIAAFKKRGMLPLPAAGALIGIALFLASSLVTSYSFRLVQNGVVFFIVLAIAVKGIFPSPQIDAEQNRPSRMVLNSFFPVAAGCCILLAAFSITRAAGVWYGFQIGTADSPEQAARSFDRSIALDSENASTRAVYGMYHFNAARYAEAALHLRRAIDLGRATSADYSYLASAQNLAGDRAAAEITIVEAVGIYPASVFVRTRYGAMLKEAGRLNEAEEQFHIARRLDPAQAETWRNFIENGAVEASKRSFENKLLPVMDLKPKSAIYAWLAEREILHPEEKLHTPL
jgi:tetratricopeptide (TPR) repeat protein